VKAVNDIYCEQPCFHFFFAFICAHSFAPPNILTFVSSLCFLHSVNASCASRWQWSLCLYAYSSSSSWLPVVLEVGPIFMHPAVSLFLFLKVVLFSSKLVCFHFNHNEYLQFDLNVGTLFVKIRVNFFSSVKRMSRSVLEKYETDLDIRFINFFVF